MRTTSQRHWVAGIAIVGLAAGLWAAHAGAAGPAPARTTPRVVTVHLSQWKYTPGIISVREGDPVTLILESSDVAHGFYLDGYGIMRPVFPGQPTEIHFVATKAGRWMFRCSVTCGPFHPYMVGWLRVAPNPMLRWGWGTVGAIGLVALYAAWREAGGR